MTIASRLRSGALLLGLLAPLPAAAQPLADAAGAQAIDQAVRDWLARQTANALDLSAMNLRVLPEGETYRLELGFGGSYFDGGMVLGDAALAVTLKPLDGGRWTIVNAALPPSLRAEMKGTTGPGSVFTMTLGQQQTTGTYDPSLTGPSTFVSNIGGYSTELQSATGNQASSVGRITGRSEWQPSAPGRITIQGDSTLEDYTTVSPLPGGETAKVSIRRLGGATRIENFDLDGLGQLLRTAFELGTAAKAAKDAGSKAPPPDKAVMHRLLAQVFGMVDALETDYSYDDIRVDAGQLFTGTLRRFAMGLSAGAPGGKMDIRLRLGLEGLETPLIPPGPWVEFVPHKLTLTPRVGGVPKEAVMALLRRAIETEGQGMEADAMALIAANPVEVAIDDLVIDMGPLRLRGEGSLEVAGPDEATGEAELRATGLDALIRRANQIPELKMAAPVLIFLKGIARQEGTEAVWHITYADRKVTVNDTDLSDLMPSK